MAIKSEHIYVQVILVIVTIIYLIPNAFCKDSTPIPADRSQVEAWFKENVLPLPQRKDTVSPALFTSEDKVKVIKMKSDGSGDFKTLQAAIDTIEDGNANKVIISLAPGKYEERVKVPRKRRFVTFYGEDPADKPILVFGGTAAKYGTFYSATLTVEGDYFSAVNVKFQNSAPRPIGGKNGQQALAVRIGGDKGSFYNCDFIGFQDTLCDDTGRHFYKDCYIEGTIDFIFGAGRSLFLNCQINVVPGEGVAYITAQGAPTKLANSGYSFVHCNVTGKAVGTTYLGRAWRQDPQVVYSYSYLSEVVNQKGWSNNNKPDLDKKVFFGEFNNEGPRADTSGRYQFMKKFAAPQAKPFISLEYILGSKWLLPPTKV